MTLNDTQKNKVRDWIDAGMKVAEIQTRLGTEFGIRLTYMEARFLLDDLKLQPRDPVAPAKPDAPAPEKAPAAEDLAEAEAADSELPPEELPEPAPAGNVPGGKVSVSIDQITRPGAMVSGKVTFSDGQNAEWHLDQYGRLGLVTEQKGYRPAQADVATFQAELQNALTKMGF